MCTHNSIRYSYTWVAITWNVGNIIIIMPTMEISCFARYTLIFTLQGREETSVGQYCGDYDRRLGRHLPFEYYTINYNTIDIITKNIITTDIRKHIIIYYIHNQRKSVLCIRSLDLIWHDETWAELVNIFTRPKTYIYSWAWYHGDFLEFRLNWNIKRS